ncbi:MAG: nuclear transport factor 2 family protein, partial [Chitinophagaceae bacterium]
FTPQITIGKSELAQKILDVWKDWDDNMLNRHADHFSDTISAYFASGGMVKGKADFLKTGAEYRNKFSDVKSTVFAVAPLRRATMNEDVVAIWGMDESTSADGKTETMQVHEVWWFNKDGKIVEMRQWEAKPTEMK